LQSRQFGEEYTITSIAFSICTFSGYSLH
jgi:hypothetical protein